MFLSIAVSVFSCASCLRESHQCKFVNSKAFIQPNFIHVEDLDNSVKDVTYKLPDGPEIESEEEDDPEVSPLMKSLKKIKSWFERSA